MFENLDQLIDKNLKIIAGYKGHYLFTHHNFRKLNGGTLSLKDQIKLSSIMQNKGLVVVNYGNKRIVDVTEKGRKIYEGGGWIKYKLTEKKEQLENKKREATMELEREKLKDDAKISKLNAKYRYVPYIISILSFVVACLAYFRPVDKADDMKLSKEEIIYITDSIVATKNDNSLKDKKIVIDSLHNSKQNQ